MPTHRLPLLLLIYLFVSTRGAGEQEDEEALNKENEALKLRLAALQERLKEEEQYTYVVAKGMIGGAENVYMETMEIGDAKQWCNSNAKCKGFSFLGSSEGGQNEPEDEVTVTFKGEPEEGGALKVVPDSAYVSYIKHSHAKSVLGAVGDAHMQLDGGSAYLVGQWLGFESAALVFVLGVVFVFVLRSRRGGGSARPLLPR